MSLRLSVGFVRPLKRGMEELPDIGDLDLSADKNARSVEGGRLLGAAKHDAPTVAGGSSGINLAIAKAFAARGAKVAIASRSQDRVDAAVAGGQSLEVNSTGDEIFNGVLGGTRLSSLTTDADAANRGGRAQLNAAGTTAAGSVRTASLGRASRVFR